MEKNGFTSRPVFNIECNEVLSGPTCDYHIEEFLGQGTFGKVARCRVPKRKELVAVKVMRMDGVKDGKNEARTMEKVRKLDPDKNNLLKLTEHFMHNNHFCLVYELLDVSLYEFMESRNFKPLQLSEIRVIAQQMLVSLKALKSINLVHGDIKPDNIMLVNHKSQPFKVKLIDFGLATEASNLWKKGVIQNLAYRSPEVLLHHPTLDEGVDMWSLGCVLAFLYLGDDIYPYYSEYEAMRMIIQLNGQPDNDFLDEALNTDCFFDLVEENPEHLWWLKSPEQYTLETEKEIIEHRRDSYHFHSLNNLLMTQPGRKNPIVCDETKVFINLLCQMLEVDPRKRITPSEALNHSFFTFKHFPVDHDSPYLISTKEMMKVGHFEEENSFSPTYEEENSRSVGSYGYDSYDTVEKLPIRNGMYNTSSKTEVTTSVPRTVTKVKPDSSKKLVVRDRMFYISPKQERETSGPRTVTGDQQNSSTSLVIKKRIYEVNSSKQEITSVTRDQQNTFKNRDKAISSLENMISAPRSVTKDLEETSEVLAFKNRTHEISFSNKAVSSVPRTLKKDQHDTYKNKTYDSRSKTDKVNSVMRTMKDHQQDSSKSFEVSSSKEETTVEHRDISENQDDIIPCLEEMTSAPRSVTKDPQNTSKDLAARNRTHGVISSGEKIISPLTMTEEQPEEPSMQPTIKVNEVKPGKKRFRGIRKFFSRLFKPVRIQLVK